MKITVRYFASIREAFGHSSEAMEVASITLGELREQLIQRPGSAGESLARGRAVRMALNQVMCDEAVALTEGCEVAFFPPVTGG